MIGPCNLTAQGGCCDGWNSATDEQKARASAQAAFFIWASSGYQYGECEVTVRPCGDDCNDYTTYWGPSQASLWFPELNADGKWVNCRSGSCSCNPCNCCHFCAVKLDGPVSSISEVKIDGLVVAEEEYFVYDESKLVRRVGCFPKCQNLQATSDEEGTFEVTYMKGKPLDPAGQAALDALACEFLKLCTGGKCKLPSRWTSLSREGISLDAIGADLITLGKTGIFEIDFWLGLVNPSGTLYPAVIPKMDGAPKLVRQTWP